MLGCKLSIFLIDSLKDIWSDSKFNSYSSLDVLNDKFGVYVFRDTINGDILYIGEAQSQSLKTRVKQNFTEKDSGGTFRKNYMEQENVNFDTYKSYIQDKQIICFTLEGKMLIHVLESILICALNPKYNKNK